MARRTRPCLKCGRMVSAGRWLCSTCRQANREYATEAVGVSDLFSEVDTDV